MNSGSSTYCTFRVAGRWFGAPIEDVKEVNRHATTTRIPHAPPEVSGYVNIRGHIYLALDAARLLGLHSLSDQQRHLILFKSSVGPSFGVVVDEIGDIVSVAESRIDDVLSNLGSHADNSSIERSDLIAELCRCPEELLVVLEPRRFLKVVERGLSAS